MIKKKAAGLVTILICATLSTTALGSELVCTEPLHIAPSAETTDWKQDQDDKIILSGFTNPNTSPTIAWFEYGESASMSSRTGFIYLGKGSANVSVKIPTKTIHPNTTYFYRLISQNENGITTGKVETLKTANK